MLVAATLAVWLSAVVWIDGSTRAQVERVLDARLVESARMVSSLLADHRVALDASGRAAPVAGTTLERISYSHELSCQIWTLKGVLVGQSGHAPGAAMAAPGVTGFSETMINGARWRVYSLVNPALGLRISVGDAIAVRDGLVGGVIRALVWPAAVVLPVLALLLWLATARGLAPLDHLAAALRARGPGDLSPLPETGPQPAEIRPVRRALDALLARVRAHRAHERDFIAFAAHELKTPLAGLKMQAQIALRAEDEATRRHALEVMDRSVSRTDRMVRQLLELARVEQAEAAGTPQPLAAIARTVLAELGPMAEARGVALQLAPGSGSGSGPEGAAVDGVLMAIALRNLVENAVQATPRGGAVVVTPGGTGLDIHDGGPGLPEALRDRVFEKFVKGAGEGSGLGLAIAREAADRLGAELSFAMEADGHHLRLRLGTAS